MKLNPLEEILRSHIAQKGVLNIAEFMTFALSHPEHGYYMKRDPFGAEGDFTTAPEISQLFGEMIGAWIVDIWIQMGRPAPINLIECGPGRGTLMADILRISKNIEGFHKALNLHLLEISPTLRAQQAKTLNEFNPQWHNALTDIPDDAPSIIIGNEFLDALPFHSLQKTSTGWSERTIDYGDEGFYFSLQLAPKTLTNQIPFHLQNAQAGSIFEVAPARYEFMTHIESRLKRTEGAALFIDYGHKKSALGDTFQAIKNHKYVDVLTHIGDADLTSHINFEALVQNLNKEIHIQEPVTQNDFLCTLGIKERTEALLKNASAQQATDLKKALHRLTASSEMGELFKILCMSHNHGTSFKPCGF